MRALIFATAGQADQSLSDATAALAIDPNLVAALIAQALVYEGQGQHGLAINQMQKAVALEPDNPTVQKLQAMFQQDTGAAQQDTGAASQ
jgi:Tfp pilus assembly protein PilF